MGQSPLDALIDQYGDRIALQEDGSVSWTLLHPLKSAEGEIGVVTLRRPRLRELRRMKGSTDTDKTAWIISTLSGIAPPHLDDMDGQDFAALGRVFGHFMGVSQPGGDA